MSIQPTSPSRSGRIVGVIFSAALISACASDYVRDTPYSSSTVAQSSSRTVTPATRAFDRPVNERAAVTAVRQIGTPYVYGGADDDGFDCSGLVYYAYQKAGRQVPRTTATLWQSLQPVAKSDVRVGDVLFFRIAGKVSHVGLYLGDRRFVHAPQSGKEVTVAALDSPFYRKAFIRAGRP